MWIFIKGWYYNLHNYTRVKLEDTTLYMKEVGTSDVTMIHNLGEKEIIKIKQILNGRNN